MTEVSSSAREIRYRYGEAEKTMNVKGVRELKDGMSIEQAAELTKNNGMDELFFECEGKRYVAFSTDTLNVNIKFGSELKMDKQDMKVLKLNDESTTFIGGAWDMTKTIGNALVKPFTLLKPVVPNTATAIAFAGGIATGLIARTGQPADYNETLSLATRIGFASGGVVGGAAVRAYSDNGPDSLTKTAKAFGTGIAGVATGMVLPDAARLIAKIPIPEFLPKAATVAGVALASGGALAIIGGGVAAATKDADLKSIDQIAK